MSAVRRAAVLQWLGVFVAPAAWMVQHGVGQGIAQVSCSRANADWSVSNDAWQIVLTAVTEVLILASLAAAVLAYRGTKQSSYHSPPPVGRVQFFSIAAMAANVIFFMIVLLDGIASIVDVACRQS